MLHFMAHRASSGLTQACPQLGLVVPKRLAKHAVRRNLIKRLAREHFRQQAGQGIGSLSAGLWVLRLHRSINHLPLSPVQKQGWATQLADLFAQGQDFATQMSRGSPARPTHAPNPTALNQAQPNEVAKVNKANKADKVEN